MIRFVAVVRIGLGLTAWAGPAALASQAAAPQPPGAVVRPPPASVPARRRPPGINANYSDPNAAAYVVNAPTNGPSTDGPAWQDLAPGLALAVAGLHGSPPYDAQPFTVRWTARLSAPLDHVDLRVSRCGAASCAQVAHYMERARPADGRVPTATTVAPQTDPRYAEDAASGRIARYVIEAVAVDVLGRASGVARVSLDVRFGPASGSPPAYDPVSLESGIARDPEFEAFGGSSDTLEIATQSVGKRAITAFRPASLRLPAGGRTVTVVNRATEPCWLRSAYTPPYAEVLALADQSIGGVAPIDVGRLRPGEARTIRLPLAPPRYSWTLYDFLRPERHQRVVVRVGAP